MYKALYRKYRPVTFDDVIGQEHITSTLKNQVLMGRLSHAYLFVGTRGTGKTTCAKILSKAVNCHNPENGSPCNKCPSCTGINSGAIMDVVELDAASNNGVENIRAIRDEAVYTPSEVRKRVYIIDEVHMLSTPAFNALLKILEEPPEHLIFILATTELHKVPATILSRCQRFSFKRITADDIAKRLSYVAEQEQLELTPEAALLLARLGDGSMRDALSLMDQCRSSQRIDEEQVMSCIGLAGAMETVNLLNCIESGDSDGALSILDKLYMAGKDPGTVLGELSSIMRDIMIMRMAPKSGEALLSGNFSLNMLRGHKIPTEKLLWCVKLLMESLASLDRSADRRTAAEFCIIQLTNDKLFSDNDALLARIAELENKLAGGVAISSAPIQTAEPQKPIEQLKQESKQPAKQLEQPAPKQAPVQTAPPVQKSAPTPAPKEAPVKAAVSPVPTQATASAAPSPTATASVAPTATAEQMDCWQQILKAIDPPKARLISDKTPVFDDGRITVNVGPGFVYTLMNQPDNIRKLEMAAAQVMGATTRVIITDKAVETSPPPAMAQPMQTVANTTEEAPQPSEVPDKLDRLKQFGIVTFE